MIGITAQHHLGGQLRATYANIPKGGIPDRIWKLLLLIERQEGISATRGRRTASASLLFTDN